MSGKPDILQLIVRHGQKNLLFLLKLNSDGDFTAMRLVPFTFSMRMSNKTLLMLLKVGSEPVSRSISRCMSVSELEQLIADGRGNAFVMLNDNIPAVSEIKPLAPEQIWSSEDGFSLRQITDIEPRGKISFKDFHNNSITECSEDEFILWIRHSDSQPCLRENLPRTFYTERAGIYPRSRGISILDEDSES